MQFRNAYVNVFIKCGHFAIQALLLTLLLYTVACHDNEDSTTCTSDTDCGSGACLPSPASHLQFCTTSAPGCSSGREWASSAGDELAGTCVLPGDAGVIDAPGDAQ